MKDWAADGTPERSPLSMRSLTRRQATLGTCHATGCFLLEHERTMLIICVIKHHHHAGCQVSAFLSQERGTHVTPLLGTKDCCLSVPAPTVWSIA